MQEIDLRLAEAAGAIGRERINGSRPMRGIGGLAEPETQTKVVRRSSLKEVHERGKIPLLRPLFEPTPQPGILAPASERTIKAKNGLLSHSSEMGPRANCCSRTDCHSRFHV